MNFKNVSKKYDVYGMGNALVDFEYLVDKSFLIEQGLNLGHMQLVDEAKQQELVQQLPSPKKKQCGGSAANTVIALAQLGGKAVYSLKVANDQDGHFYLDDLHKNSVHHHIDKNLLAPGTTGKCVVFVTPDSERTMCTYLGITSSYDILQVDWEHLKDSQFLYIEGYLMCTEVGFQAALKARDFARDHGVHVALTFSDPGILKFFAQRFKILLEHGVDLLFANEEEALTYSETSHLDEAMTKLQKIAKHAVVTRSAKGVRLHHGGLQFEVAAPKVSAIDANGAGDMFAGAYLFAVTRGWDSQKAAELACQAAATVVQQYGPRLTPEQLKNILATF